MRFGKKLENMVYHLFLTYRYYLEKSRCQDRGEMRCIPLLIDSPFLVLPPYLKISIFISRRFFVRCFPSKLYNLRYIIIILMGIHFKKSMQVSLKKARCRQFFSFCNTETKKFHSPITVPYPLHAILPFWEKIATAPSWSPWKLWNWERSARKLKFGQAMGKILGKNLTFFSSSFWKKCIMYASKLILINFW